MTSIAHNPMIANLENEQDLIGCLMHNNSRYPEFSHVGSHHFAEPLHQRIWEVMASQIEAGGTASLGSLRTALRGDPALDDMNKVAGGDYLALLCDKTCHPSYAADCATAIIDDWTRRSAMEIGQNVIGLASSTNPRPALEVLSYARQAFSELEGQSGVSEAEFQPATAVATSVIEQLAENLRTGRQMGKRCGLRCVDYRMGGFHPGALVVLAGRPSMGKTALARAMAHGCAVHNPKDEVLFLGIEMSPSEMMERELSSLTADTDTPVEFRDLSNGKLTPQDMATIHRVSGQVPANLVMKDCPSLSIDDVRRAIWTRRRKKPLALVVIDYLGIMRRPDARGRNEASVVAEITGALKQLARQAKCTILLLSQLNRGVEAREDKRPMLSDLRESGAIEQDADFVLFVYREAYYLSRTTPPRGQERDHDMRLMDVAHQLEVICAKARRGAVGMDLQNYQAEFDHITDMRGAA